MTMERTVMTIFAVLGTLFLLGTSWSIGLQWRFLQSSETAIGQVVDLERSRSDDGYVFYPYIRYTTKEGQTLTFRNPVGSNPHPQIGERVKVRYDPRHPAGATLSGFFDLWLVPFVMGILGICFAGVGYWGLFRFWWKPRFRR